MNEWLGLLFNMKHINKYSEKWGQHKGLSLLAC